MTNALQAHSSEIECDACARSIQRALGKLPGVQSVQVDVDTQNISVQYDPGVTTETAIHDRLIQAGFPSEQNAH